VKDYPNESRPPPLMTSYKDRRIAEDKLKEKMHVEQMEFDSLLDVHNFEV